MPAQLLIELGQERKAAKLFLKSRTEAQRYSQKSLRVEGSLILYASKFCRSFFDHIRETAKEFNHDFEARPVNYSALVVWTKNEINEFVIQLSTQIFQPNVEIGDQARRVHFCSRKRYKIVKPEMRFRCVLIIFNKAEK